MPGYSASESPRVPLLSELDDAISLESSSEWRGTSRQENRRSPLQVSTGSFHEKNNSVDDSTPSSPVSLNDWTNPASEPLLAEAEDKTNYEEGKEQCNEEASSPRSGEEKKSNFSNAEYKIAFSHFVRIFTYSTWSDRLVLIIASSASICIGVTLPLMNVVFGQLAGEFSEFYNPESGETKTTFLQTINRYVLYMVYLFFARLLLDYVAILGFKMVSIRISAAMRLAYLGALFKQPISALDTLPPGQTAAIITITTNILQYGISEKLSIFLQSVSLVITAIIIAFHYSWQLTLVTGSGMLVIVFIYSYTTPRLVNKMNEVEHADRMSSSIASEVFGSIRMVAACEAESKMAKRHAGWVAESERRGLLMSPLIAGQQAPVFFTIHATFALSFWVAIKLYTAGTISSVTTIIVVLMSIMTIVMSIGSISAPLSAATRSAGAAGILFTIIDAPNPRTGHLKSPEVSSQKDIVFENVNFAYPIRHDVKVLENVNLTFPAGKITAIVGASGSGKSTIVGLIERWYELDGNPTDNPLVSPRALSSMETLIDEEKTLFFRNGTITVGGQKLHEIDLKWWRSQIGLVQQEPFLFNDTIFKNVEYGLVGTPWENASAKKKRELIRRACKEAFAEEFIIRLPEGYNTTVGDAGIKLSGGQRQRLAIARSIVKRPKILILDEATSAIDVRGERIVQAALDKVSKGRTTIMIAHRLSTIMDADKIVVLQKGQVVQQGTHSDLLAEIKGPYWTLANAQKLSLDDRPSLFSDLVQSQEEYTDIGDDGDETSEAYSIDLEDPISPRSQDRKNSLFNSFGLFLWEQMHQWKGYSLMLSGALGVGVSFPLHAFLFAKLISLFNFWGQYLEDQTNFWCFIFTILALGVGVSYFVLGWSSNAVSFTLTSQRITSMYRQEYFRNTLKKPVSYYDEEENSVGSLTARMACDPSQLQQLLGINMAIVLISIFNIVGSIAMSFYFGWKLTLITVCFLMPIILAAGFFRIRYETQFEKMNEEVFAESSKFATESIGAFRTVSSLTLESAICGRYQRLLQDHSKKTFGKAKFSTLVFAMSDSVSLLCMAFVLWYGGQLLASHEYTPFNYLVVYLAVIQGSTSAGQSLSFGPNIVQAFAAAERIRSMRLATDKSIHYTSLNLGSAEDNEKAIRGVQIELKNLWFQYPTRDVSVLQGLNMTIERGQFAAIVGASGSGKTSIISLLERFYKVQSGIIKFHGVDINEISQEDYRKCLSLVAQEASLFEGSIRDNILLGVDEDGTSDEMIFQACRDADIHDFISSLPEGYQTAVGTKGIALSGGQKQRIAIARALIRNPRVLLLDEATSNLDSEIERSVQMVLEKTGRGRTMIVVAHRLATVQNADIIFVVGDGRVVEKGTHNTLLHQRGLYYEMCQSQAFDS